MILERSRYGFSKVSTKETDFKASGFMRYPSLKLAVRAYVKGLTQLTENPAVIITDFYGGGLSTILTVYIGGLFNRLFFGNPYLINIGFQTITFLGLVYLLYSVAPAVRLRLLALVMLPSFTLWTSIASKEAIVAAAVAVLSAYFVRMYSGHVVPGVHHVLATLVLYIFKPHYGVALVYGIGTTLVCRIVRRKALVAFSIGLVSL